MVLFAIVLAIVIVAGLAALWSWATSICNFEGVENEDRRGTHHWRPRAEVRVVPTALVPSDDDPLNPMVRPTEARHTPHHSIRSVQYDLAGKPEWGQHALASNDDYVPPHMYVITKNGNGYLCTRGYWHPGFGVGSADNVLSPTALRHHAMVFMDARSAHDYARRARYHIPQWWEWAALGIIAVGQTAHIVIGDKGLLP